MKYIYRFLNGDSVCIPAEEIGTSLIVELEELDRDERNAERRALYHAPVHYEGYQPDDRDKDSINPYLTDKEADPLEGLLRKVHMEEHKALIKNLRIAVQSLEPQQRELIYRKFVLRQKNVEIAAAFSVTEAAVRKRLKKIYKILREQVRKV